MWYLGAGLSGHSTGPVSSGTPLKNIEEKLSLCIDNSVLE